MSRHEPRPPVPVATEPAEVSADVVRATGTLAHDINNLLTAVIGYATLVSRSFDQNDPRRADAAEIIAAAQQAGSLAHEILVMTGRRPRADGTFIDTMAALAEPAVVADSPRVLVVEDDRTVRYLVRTVLTRAGYDVREASSAEAAEAWLAEHAAGLRLLISDVVMPGGSGADLSRRACAANPDLRVLYMSGYAEEEIRRRLLLTRGTAFIQKPFNGEELTGKVRDVLRT